VKRVVGFNEKHAGPIERVLLNPSSLSMSELKQSINTMHQALSSHNHFNVAQGLYELSGEDSLDSVIHLCSDVHYYSTQMQSSVIRAAVQVAEAAALVEIRNIISVHLNATLSGKCMPVVVKVFLGTLWSDVLFHIIVASGQSSSLWQDAIQLQHALLESVTPVNDAEQLASLNQVIPGVVKGLRKLLDETGCRFDNMATFLGELKLLHLQNMQQQLNRVSFVEWTDVSSSHATSLATPLLGDDEWACYGQMKEMLSLLSC
jgi:hypothetical protein